MKTEFFTCTCLKDFSWLKYCLRSLVKSTSGFQAANILVPKEDLTALQSLIAEATAGQSAPLAFNLLTGDEWFGQGMVWHEYQVMMADTHCPNADFIAHIDPDCVFTSPVTPETFIVGDRPILRFENFHFIGVRHPGTVRWQECTAKCLPFPVHYETMRCHPEVYHRGLYAVARAQMEQKTGKPLADYVRACRNEFPQGFCEYVTLGNVAMQFFRDQYYLVEQTGDHVTPDNHLQQFWSHSALDAPQNIWVQGEQKMIIPIAMMHQLGLT